MSALIFPCEPCVVIRPIAVNGRGEKIWAPNAALVRRWEMQLQIPVTTWLADAPDRVQAFAIATMIGDSMGLPVIDMGFDQ